MVFTQIKYNGKTIYPYQIQNKKFYFKSKGKIYNFPYRLDDVGDIYIEGTNLMIGDHGQVNEPYENVELYNYFSVTGEDLIITL